MGLGNNGGTGPPDRCPRRVTEAACPALIWLPPPPPPPPRQPPGHTHHTGHTEGGIGVPRVQSQASPHAPDALRTTAKCHRLRTGGLHCAADMTYDGGFSQSTPLPSRSSPYPHFSFLCFPVLWAVLKNPNFFVKDSPQGPPTTNRHQPPPTANHCSILFLWPVGILPMS